MARFMFAFRSDEQVLVNLDHVVLIAPTGDKDTPAGSMIQVAGPEGLIYCESPLAVAQLAKLIGDESEKIVAGKLLGR